MSVTKKRKIPKKQNPETRANRINARLSNRELQIVLEKALVFAHGNISLYARLALLNYKPQK